VFAIGWLRSTTFAPEQPGYFPIVRRRKKLGTNGEFRASDGC
jgi:hypothetical protein